MISIYLESDVEEIILYGKLKKLIKCADQQFLDTKLIQNSNLRHKSSVR